jgi:hypothetical protein
MCASPTVNTKQIVLSGAWETLEYCQVLEIIMTTLVTS